MKQSDIEELEKLREMCEGLAAQQDTLVKMGLLITKEDNESGFTFDYLLNGLYTTEELLIKLKSTIRIKQ